MKDEELKATDIWDNLSGLFIQKKAYFHFDGNQWENTYTIIDDYDVELMPMKFQELKQFHRFIGEFIEREERIMKMEKEVSKG